MELLWFRKQFYARDLRRISHQMHRHAFYEVHFPFAGEVTYELKDGGSFTLDKGRYLLLPPGAEHCLAHCTPDYAKFSFAFSVSLKDLAPHGFSLSQIPVCLPVSQEMTQAISLTHAAAARADALTPVCMRDSLFLLATLLMESRQKTAIGDLREDVRLLRAKQFITDNRMRAISVGEVAAFVHLSERQFTRMFEEGEGVTPLQYIRRERCAAAREMLLSGSEVLSVIAERLDFSCEYNFIRFFKSVEGFTPAAFRRAAHAERLTEDGKKTNSQRNEK